MVRAYPQIVPHRQDLDMSSKQAFQLTPRHSGPMRNLIHGERKFDILLHEPHCHQKLVTHAGKGKT